MPGPNAPTPYEVLGVSAAASTAELRRAYRRMLRETHPDTGGDAKRFQAVQHAWQVIGRPEDRTAYDQGRAPRSEPTHAPRPAPARQDSRPLARSYGHPGGWRRERYLALMHEWVGRGVRLDDPYDPALVRSAPRDIRHMLADALAEEETARQLSRLGIAYTVWHDVATDGGPDDKLDHIVLGPTGLYAILSEDWGGQVRVRKGELVGETLGADQPIQALSVRSRSIARSARVKFSALVVVVPDDASDSSLIEAGRVRGAPAVVVQRSRLPELMRNGLPVVQPIGGTELFDARTRLQNSVRFAG